MAGPVAPASVRLGPRGEGPRIIETARGKRPRFKEDHVTMAHGAGGKATQTLIEGLLLPGVRLGRGRLAELGDAGVVRIEGPSWR